MSTVVVPPGPNTATVQVLDANGADITGSCSITAVSSDPTVVQVGSPDASTPNVIPLTALKEGGACTITYTGSNAMGSATQTDNVSVALTAPASMTVVYGATVPVAPAPVKK
jgi:hypothetical protein